MSRSVELRITVEGHCCCGIPYPSDNPPPDHAHHIECDWGRIEHTDPRPDRGAVGHLLLATGWVIGGQLDKGPIYRARDVDDDYRIRWQAYNATSHGDRLFVSTAWPIYSHGDGTPREDGAEEPPTGCQRWTWELFPAHFADGKGPDNIFVGRWPD